MAEAQVVQELAHGALVIGHTEALGDDALQVDPPLAHHPIPCTIRPGLNKTRELGQLLR